MAKPRKQHAQLLCTKFAEDHLVSDDHDMKEDGKESSKNEKVIISDINWDCSSVEPS